MVTTIPIAALAILAFVAIRRPPYVLIVLFHIFAYEQVLLAMDAAALLPGGWFKYVMGCITLVACFTFVLQGYATLRTYILSVVPPTLFLSYVAATAFWSIDPDVSYRMVVGYLPYLVVVSVLGPCLIASADDLVRVLETLAQTSALFCLYVLFALPWGVRGVLASASKVEMQPLALGDLGAWVFIISAIVLLMTRRTPLLYGSAAVLGLLLAVKSGSRAQVIAAVSVVPISALLNAKLPRRRLIVFALVLVATAVFLDDVIAMTSAGYRWTPQRIHEDVFVKRLPLMQALLHAWVDADSTGILLGLGTSASFSHLIPGVSIYPHCIPVEILAETGLVGFGFYCVLLAATVVNLASARRYRTVHPGVELAFLLVLSLSLFEFLMTLKSGTTLGHYRFWALCVIAAQLGAFARTSASSTNSRGID